MTEDGYILTLFRIPRGTNETNKTVEMQKQPVLLQHGFLASAMNWVINLPNQSLGITLKRIISFELANSAGTKSVTDDNVNLLFLQINISLHYTLCNASARFC